MSEIKIGDTVDCSGNAAGTATCANGKVHNNMTIPVAGNWTDGAMWHHVLPSQITRHVPAAPVVERPKSCGDKLASEMKVRERMALDILAGMAGDSSRNGTPQVYIDDAIAFADALIAALDKERA